MAWDAPTARALYGGVKCQRLMKLDVFGTEIEALKSEEGWQVFYLGGDGKKRLAKDIVIPPYIEESEIATYLADIRHEFASTRHPEVNRIG
jgi:hypothetical protein